MYPRRIEVFETSDGKTFPTELIAKDWQERLLNVRTANNLIDRGLDLAAVLDMIGQPFPSSDRDVFAMITKDAKLIISHWQCRDQPGYSLVRMENEGGFFVHGHAGSWSGSYGAVVDLVDLIRYARTTMERCGGKLPKEGM